MCEFELKQFKLKIKSTATFVYVILGDLLYMPRISPIYTSAVIHTITLAIPKGFGKALCTPLVFAPFDIEHNINHGPRNNW